MMTTNTKSYILQRPTDTSIIGLVVEYIVAIDVTRVRFPDDAFYARTMYQELRHHVAPHTFHRLGAVMGFVMAWLAA